MSEYVMEKAPLREGPGVRLKMAKEFVGFTDESDNEFRKAALAAGVDPSAMGNQTQRRYLPFEIRKIRKFLASVYPEFRPEGYLPPLMVFRITKGGTGKTTLCANSAVGLAMQGHRVLVIDADSQGSISLTLGYDINAGIGFGPDSEKADINKLASQNLVHIGHILQRVANREPSGIAEAVVPVYADGMLDLLPANITLANEAWMYNATARELLFERLLEQEREFFSRYDAILIDCAPGTSLLATTIMAAATAVTAVVTPEPQAIVALYGIENNLLEINEVVRRGRPPVSLHVVVNDVRAIKPHKDCEAYLLKNYRTFLNPGSVRSYVGFKREIDVEDTALSAPLVERETISPGAADVLFVLKQLTNLYGVKIHAEPEAVQAEIAEEVA